MDVFNEINAMLTNQGFHEPISLWYAEAPEIMQGKPAGDYEKEALTFYAEYFEMQAGMMDSIGSSLASLGISGFQFGNGYTHPTDTPDPVVEQYKKLAELLRSCI